MNAAAVVFGILAVAIGCGPSAFHRELRERELRGESPADEAPASADGACEEEWVHLPQLVSFAHGSVELDPQRRELLRELLPTLRRPGVRRLRIEGHAERCGQEGDAMALGRGRAESVHDALRAFGEALPELEIVSYGDTMPRADNFDCTPAGRREYQRVSELAHHVERRVELSMLVCTPE